jgi:hypothetical protein
MGVFLFLTLGITDVDLTWGLAADKYYGFAPPFLMDFLLGVSTGLLLNYRFLGSKWFCRILPDKWTRCYCAVELLVLIWIVCVQYMSAIATVRIMPPRPLIETETEQIQTLCPWQDWKYRSGKNAFLIRRNSPAREQITRYLESISKESEREK